MPADWRGSNTCCECHRIHRAPDHRRHNVPTDRWAAGRMERRKSATVPTNPTPLKYCPSRNEEWWNNGTYEESGGGDDKTLPNRLCRKSSENGSKISEDLVERAVFSDILCILQKFRLTFLLTLCPSYVCGKFRSMSKSGFEGRNS